MKNKKLEFNVNELIKRLIRYNKSLKIKKAIKKPKTKFVYDEEAGCGYLYIGKTERKAYTTEASDLYPNLIYDFDKRGNLIGIEILYLDNLLVDLFKAENDKGEKV